MYKRQGGEPLLYPHLIELIKYAHYECNIDDISITTNGIGLNEIAYELKRSGLKSVNISLDSLKSYKYKSITRGGNLTDVLKSINRCLELGIKVKINCVVIKRFNDDEVYDFKMCIRDSSISLYNILKPSEDIKMEIKALDNTKSIELLGYSYDDIKEKANINIDLKLHKASISG